MKAISTLLAALIVLANCPSAGAKERAPAPPVASKIQKIVVPVSVFSDAQIGGYWLMRMAANLQKKGAQVALVLFTNGVRLADNRAIDDFGIEGEAIPISQAFADFTQSGGKILVEATYAKKLGLEDKNLRPGAKLVDDQSLTDEILAADKILNF